MRVATPSAPMGTLPKTVDPEAKVTVPVGGWLPEPWTTEIRISCWPVEIAVEEVVRLVVVGRSTTVWMRLAEAAGTLSSSPE